MLARILYSEKKWEQLKRFKANNAEAQIWRLMSVARTDVKAAAPKLLQLSKSITLEMPQLKVLVEYFAERDDIQQFNKYTRLLVEEAANRATRLLIVANDALSKKDINTAKILLGKIETYDDTVDGVGTLKKRIKESKKIRI